MLLSIFIRQLKPNLSIISINKQLSNQELIKALKRAVQNAFAFF